MATISKRTSASGEVTYQAKCRRKGFPTKSKTFAKRSDAITWARQIERAFDTGEALGVADKSAHATTTVGDVLRKFRNEVCPTLRGGKIDQERIDRWLAAKWTKTPILDLTPTILAKFRDDRLKTAGAGTVLRELNIIRSALNRARTDWGIPVPECKITRPKAPAARDRRLKSGEFDRLMDGCARSRNKQLRPAVILAIETAARQGELLKLTWAHVDMVGRVARFPITKNGTPRTIPLSTRAIEALTELQLDRPGSAASHPKFTHVLWRYANDRSSLKHAFARLTKRVGIEGLRFHDLRREGVSRMLEKGLNIVEVSQVSGHKTLSMIQRYAAPRPEDIALKLG